MQIMGKRSTRYAGALALAIWCHAAIAAEPPSAGSILQGIRPPSQVPAKPATVLPEEPERPAMRAGPSVRIEVKGFRITGARAFPEAELQKLLADSVRKALSLTQLQDLAARITRYYREHGYLLARAYLPAQEIRDGIVEIAVLEGRLGKLQFENHSLVSDATVQSALQGVQVGKAVEAGSLERRLLLLNDLPGVEVRSSLKPGASVGTTDLDIQLLGTRRVTGFAGLDNFGNRFTGDLRMGAGLNVNSPAGIGDSLSLSGVAAADLDYARAAYQLPVGAQGLKLGLAGSHLSYRLGKDFAPLRAHGTADIASLYGLYPLVRSRAMNVNLQLAYDAKHLDDREDAIGIASDKRIGVWSIGASGDRIDGLAGGGLWNWSAAYSGGDLRLDPISETLDAAGLGTQGGYGKTTGQIARLQHLADRVSLYVRLNGQASGKNLDASEKMVLGGPYGVRAYPEGEAPCDDALLGSVELRYALAESWQLTGFVDAAQGRISHVPLPGTNDNHRSLSAAGFGLNWSRTADFFLQSFLAWRTGAAPTSDVDRSPRLWVQLVKYM
jgi:hemolysin activation/secretion protein